MLRIPEDGVFAVLIGIALHVLVVPIGLAQQAEDPRIQPDLRVELQRLRPGEQIRVIIRLKDQLSAEARRGILRGREGAQLKRPDLKKHRGVLVKTLQDYAAKRQARVVKVLRELEREGVVRNVKPLWLANVIGAEIDPKALTKLVALEEIQYIKQDVPRPVFQQANSWGIDQISANQVWALPTPYTGSGVVVGVLDTGVDLNHGDLRNRIWINGTEDANGDGSFTVADNDGTDADGNGYVDDVAGWNFGNNNNTPDDFNGHGTHVAGTIAGDGTGGTHTGVSPGARLMVLRYSATLVAGQTEAWDGMQYALANGADIVSFSSGWKDAWAPDYATWRQNTDTLTDAGVLFVVAAGNDGPHVPAPGDVLTPARTPRAMGVGATDNTDTIGNFSGNGPTTWQNIAGYNDYIHPPGLIKPDVSAPGVSVLSTQNGGGYINGALWSGTSMATPHVSGTAALLLQKDPTLLPHELMYIIRETALDLGTAGPDNTYGYGRLDALAATNLAYARSSPYDLSVTGTNAVWTTADIWVDNNDDGSPDNPIANQHNHLYARARNLGGESAGNVEVKFFYADVGTIGISGFDPNGDGDPADGNFNYIDSYFVPVIGPAGSSQAEAVALVDWSVLVPTGDHWCVGIGIVAHNPPNATENIRANNVAFKNFFNIEVGIAEARAFRFLVYPDPRRPKAAFNLEILRRGLPLGYEVQLDVDAPLAERWFKKTEGLERVKHPSLKNLPDDNPLVLQAAGPRVQSVRLVGDKGVLRGIAVPEGRPIPVQVVVYGPKRGIDFQDKTPALLIINASDDREAFGGFTLNVMPKKGIPRLKP